MLARAARHGAIIHNVNVYYIRHRAKMEPPPSPKPIYPFVDITPENLRQIETKRSRKIVFTFGAFDLLNSAHLRIINNCRKNGDVLVLGLYSDNTIKQITGDENRPINDLNERIICLREVGLVDYIYLIDGNNTIEDFTRLLQPDVIVIGEKHKHILPPTTARLEIYKNVPNISTNSTICRICERYI